MLPKDAYWRTLKGLETGQFLYFAVSWKLMVHHGMGGWVKEENEGPGL